MKARCLSIVSSEIPFLYPSVGRRPSPFGFFESGGKLPDPLTCREAQDCCERAFPPEFR